MHATSICGLILAVLHSRPGAACSCQVCMFSHDTPVHYPHHAAATPHVAAAWLRALTAMHVASQHGHTQHQSQLRHMRAMRDPPGFAAASSWTCPPDTTLPMPVYQGVQRSAVSGEQWCSSFRPLRRSRAAVQRRNAMHRLSAAAEQPSSASGQGRLQVDDVPRGRHRTVLEPLWRARWHAAPRPC